MAVPYLNEIRTSRQVTDVWGGYDHRGQIAESSFYETENLCGDAYPAVTPRRARRGIALPGNAARADALLSGDREIVAADGKLYVDNEAVMTLSKTGPKRLIAMGAYVIVLPDKAYYNTADPSDSGKIEQTNKTRGAEVRYALCDGEGKDFGAGITKSKTPPEEPENGDLWLDTGGKPSVLKQYSEATGVWTGVLSTTVSIHADGIGKGLKAGDGVRITGLPHDEKDSVRPLSDYNGKDVILTAASDNEIAITGIMNGDAIHYSKARLTVARRMPVTDHVFECGNRLWGCRYGEDQDGNFVNEIYASALGDFKNWKTYEGLSTDAYAATVGSEGAWTGGIAFQGMPHFFKENVLYRVYGSYPAAYRIDQTACRGVQAGAEASLQILDERLYYKSRTGVCVYDGAYPTEISPQFGEIRYTGTPETGAPAAAAGAWEHRYYISMLSEADGRYHFFVYDGRMGAWYREDCTEARQFAVQGGELRFIDGDGRLTGADGGREAVAWSCETGVLGMSVPGTEQTDKLGAAEHKRVSRLTLRVGLEPGSRFRVLIQYDGMGGWEPLGALIGARMRTVSLPVRPKRCDHYRLRFEGEGPMRLYSMMKTLEPGGEY